MSLRQLPLFPNLPTRPEDISPRTALKHTIALFQAHLAKEGKSEHTLKAFTADLHLLAEYSGDDVQVGEYTTRRLDEFMRWLEVGRGIPCSRKSYARRVTTLKVYFKWLHSLGAVMVDPARPLLQRSGQAPLSDIVEDDELEALYSYAYSLRIADKPDARPELILRLLAETGIKKSETARLLLDDIARAGRYEARMTVRHSSAKDIYKERHIELSGAWLAAFDEYVPQYRPKDALFTCTMRNLEYILSDLALGAGLEKKPSFEMLRWTCAVRDYTAGMDPDAIREKLGLSKISWVETFAKIKRLSGDEDYEDQVAGV